MTDAEVKLAAFEFMAPILEAQMRFDQGITNRLMSTAWEEAEKYATRLRDVLKSVDRVNDSIKVAGILDQFWEPDIDRRIEHFRDMKERA